ncbi:hypothetical protein T439DRAFT_353357 [Meredithblackwellia eburnea MCA 4105]
MRPSRRLLLSVLLALLPTTLAQIGTSSANISSDSTQMSYISTWRSQTADGGVYEAYSNASDAAVTFSFIGVAAKYVAIRKKDRGLCQLVLDDSQAYTVDLYDNSGYPQTHAIIWASPTLPYGQHNVTLQQIGPDARFGYYPYLFTETWIQIVPTNVASYTATEVRTTPTSGSSATGVPSTGKSVSIAPIVGGAVGGVVALGLISFLVFLWRKDKRSKERGGGRMIKKVKRAEGKMSIDDDQDDPRGDGNGGRRPTPAGYVQQHQHWGMGGGNPYDRVGSVGGTQSGHSPDDVYGSYGSGWPHEQYGSVPSAGGPFRSETSSPPQLVGSPYHQHQPYDPNAYRLATPDTGAPTSEWNGGYSNTTYGNMVPVADDRDSRLYPYHEQGEGRERRNYPVPEI